MSRLGLMHRRENSASASVSKARTSRPFGARPKGNRPCGLVRTDCADIRLLLSFYDAAPAWQRSDAGGLRIARAAGLVIRQNSQRRARIDAVTAFADFAETIAMHGPRFLRQ